MADLDDFFAKKDKKKSKTKKFISSEELVKQLEQSAKEEKEQSKSTDEVNEGIIEDDDEWREFEESKKPDLTNLKLGQLTLDEEFQNQIANSSDYDADNTVTDETTDNENPWKKGKQPAAATVQKTEEKAAVVNKSGVYVPPVFKGVDNVSKNRGKKNAPDLKSEEFFPSLGTQKPGLEQQQSKFMKKDGFEEVKHGQGVRNINVDSGSASVSLGNAYSTLFTDVDS